MKRHVNSQEHRDQRHVTLKISWVVGSVINQDDALGEGVDLEEKGHWMLGIPVWAT